MISLHNIRAIAKYETTTLLRSWFFRIFAILAMVVLIFFNVGTLIQMGGGAGMWALKALPANIPYVNLLLLNVVQAIIAIFLASDFLKRDKKLDTTEVIYMRPMTNGEAAEYVFEQTASDTPAPDTVLGDFEQRRRFQMVLEELPDEQRVAIQLRLEQELSLEEIGSITGAGRETVKSRIRYALARIREKFGT